MREHIMFKLICVSNKYFLKYIPKKEVVKVVSEIAFWPNRQVVLYDSVVGCDRKGV